MSILNPNMQKNVLGLRVISNFTGSKKAFLNKIFFRDKTTAFSCVAQLRLNQFHKHMIHGLLLLVEFENIVVVLVIC